jgi:hypothetical protein
MTEEEMYLSVERFFGREMLQGKRMGTVLRLPVLQKFFNALNLYIQGKDEMNTFKFDVEVDFFLWRIQAERTVVIYKSRDTAQKVNEL